MLSSQNHRWKRLRLLNHTPRSPHCPLDSQHLLFNVRSEHPQTMPSKTDPTDAKGDTSSWKFDTTQARSESHCTQIPSTRQPSVVSLESRLPKTCEDRVDDDSVLPDHTIVALCSHSSTSTHTSDTREWGSLKNEAKVVEVDEQVTGETEAAAEGEEVTVVSCVRPYPIQPTSTQSTETSPPPTTLQPSSSTRAPAKTLTSSTTLRSTSAASYIFDSAHNLHRGRQISSLPSFAKAIPQPLACSSPSTTSPLTLITRASAKTSPPPTMSSRILVPAKMAFPTTASLSSSMLQPRKRHCGSLQEPPTSIIPLPIPTKSLQFRFHAQSPFRTRFTRQILDLWLVFPQRDDTPSIPFYPFHSIPLQGLKNDR